MGLLDDIKAAYGEDFFEPRDRQPTHSWHGLCVCGHLDRYHSESVGGLYELPEPRLQKIGGQDVTVTTLFHGCVGALRPRGFVEVDITADREAKTMVHKINVTCPCEEYRGVASVDRPNRFFNQRMPTDRSDPLRHPFMVGIRAFSTHLGKRKAAQEDPDWATAELERRLTWNTRSIPRQCEISSCHKSDDVFPVFVNDDGASELRCPNHR
jgi:hypothetical protein